MARSALAKQLDKVRHRYNRYAARLEKQAAQASGATRQMLNSLAERMQLEARKFSLANLRNKYSNEDLEKAVGGIVKSSDVALSSAQRNTREEMLGNVLLGSSDISSRFYAGTIEIWRGLEGEARDAAIIEFFGVDNIYQAMELLIDKTGKDLFALSGDINEDTRYKSTQDAIREEVAARMALG